MSSNVEAMITRVLGEDKLTLAGAATVFGEFGGGPRLHPATVARWVTRGVKLSDGRRVRLEAARLGGKFITSRQAIVRFVAAQTESGDDADVESPRTPAARNKASERAAAELAAIGI